MHGLVPIAFLAWPVLTVVLFRLRPGPGAAFVSLFGGWALLPTAMFPAGASGTFDAMTGVALPTRLFLTKATVIGASALLGVLLSDGAAFRRLKLHPLDLALLAFCLTPLASGVANGEAPGPALRASLYLLLAWIPPWLLGRIYLIPGTGYRTWLKGLALLGLLYLPFVLTEFALRPFWYRALFGYHPYRASGIVRYVGFRPIVFLEDGNQLGMWMAASALAAVGWWKVARRRLPAVLSLVLAAATFLCQSAGSILLLLAGLAVLALAGRRGGRLAVCAMLLAVASWLVIRTADLVPVRTLSKETGVGRWTKQTLKSLKRGSLGFRLKREEEHLARAWDHPVLGRGRWDWWREGEHGRPWGLWMLVFGAYGLVGLLLLVLTVLGPVALHALRTGPSPPSSAGTALAVILVLCFADSLLNSTFVVVIVSAAGGLVSAAGSALNRGGKGASP